MVQCVLRQQGYGLLSIYFTSQTVPRLADTLQTSYPFDIAASIPPSSVVNTCSGPVIPAFARYAHLAPVHAAVAGFKILQLAPSPRNAQVPPASCAAIPMAYTISSSLRFKSFAHAAAAPMTPAVEVACHPRFL